MTERRYVDKTVTNISDDLLEHSLEEEMHIFRLAGNDHGYMRMQLQHEKELEIKRKLEDDRIINEFLAKSASTSSVATFSEESVRQMKRSIIEQESADGDGFLAQTRLNKEEKVNISKPNVIVKKRKVDDDAKGSKSDNNDDEKRSAPATRTNLEPATIAASKQEQSDDEIRGKNVINILCEYGEESDEDASSS